MEINGYKYIAHKIIPRSWGIEGRFTVDKDGRHINDIAMMPSEKMDEKEIGLLIEERLKLIDRPIEPNIPERIFTETGVKALMIEKGYLTEGQKLEDLKTKVELIAVKGEVIIG